MQIIHYMIGMGGADKANISQGECFGIRQQASKLEVPVAKLKIKG